MTIHHSFDRARLYVVAAAAAALLALLAAAPAAAGYGGPRGTRQFLSGVQISTTVDRLVLIRLHVPTRYVGHRFVITVNHKLVARGHVSKKAKILTVFGTKHSKVASRGAVIVIKIDGKIIRWIRR